MRCTSCQTVLAEEAFWWKNKSRGERQSRCIDCMSTARGSVPWREQRPGPDDPRDCRGCGKTLPANDFHWRIKSKGVKQSQCKRCLRVVNSRPWHYWIRSKYGLTELQYTNILENQDNRCAICGRTPEDVGKRLYVDHDEVTGVVRGLLCMNCNVAIGHLKHDIALLRQAIPYLGEDAA